MKTIKHLNFSCSPQSQAQAQKVLDVGCTDPSIFATLAHEGKQVVGLVQVDSEDADDTQVLNHLKHELEGYGVVSCPPYNVLF